MIHLWLPLGAGYALDLLCGDPRWLPHPVVAYGRAIAVGERWLNRGTARVVRGGGLVLVLVGATAALWAGAEVVAHGWSPMVGLVVATLGVFFGLANRTLVAEGRAVFVAVASDLEAGRRRLARIVGRDTGELDAREVRIATAETMAENLSDGVVAPLFYFGLGGVPGMMAYKMINTLDSMLGHRDARREHFGKVAARLDDVANFVPARLTAGLMVLVTGSGRGARFVRRYGRAHASPNAGYPEAALAGILDVRFGGPHDYDGERIEKPWIGTNPRDLDAKEIRRIAWVNHAVCFAMVLVAGGLQWMLHG